MELMEYKSLIENKFGPLALPETNEEIDAILQTIDDSMESVSLGDYHLFQAIEIIIAWRNNHDQFIEGKDRTNDKRC